MALTLSPTIAHEGREVGDYELVFGWRVEPAIVGVLNGPELTINIHEEGEGDEADGENNQNDDGKNQQQQEGENNQQADEEDHDMPADIEASLQVEVTFGPASRTIDLRPAFGETGHYIADMIPTRPGDYSFRVFGTIGDLEIDETFASADGSFSSVEPASDLQFPEADPTIAELVARIEALEAEVTALKGE
jgi:hypothetical protein